MNTPKAVPSKIRNDSEPYSFPITEIVGRVVVNRDDVGQPPHTVAFGMIAELDREGTFSFPMPDGRACEVIVAFRDQPFETR